jgi:STE24 endopeptidase
MDDNEILAILAHEIGHWKHRHIVRRLITSSALTLAGLYLAFWLIRWGGLPGLLDLPAASFPAQLLILSLLSAIVTFPLAPLANALSRRQERQADRFACRLTGRPLDLAEALVKLARDNLAALHPHPLYAWFRFSHPPIVKRVRALLEQAKEKPKLR